MFKKSMQFQNLFLKGLEPSTTEQDLRSYFQEYGEISSIKLPGPGTAFVCFKERDAARSAKESAVNKPLNGKNFYCTYCEPKELRMAHIEEQQDKRAYERAKQREMLSSLTTSVASNKELQQLSKIFEVIATAVNQGNYYNHNQSQPRNFGGRRV